MGMLLENAWSHALVLVFDILKRSYSAPLQISDPTLDTDLRIMHRCNFFSRWKIPNTVIEEMLKRTVYN